MLAGCLGLFELHALVQGSPRDSENDGKVLLPNLQSINWNQDLSGTAISQYETFDSSDSTDGAGRGETLCQISPSTPAAFSMCMLLPDMLGASASPAVPKEAPLLSAPQCSISRAGAASVFAGLESRLK